MPVVKKRYQQTESRLLLESEGPVELPPATIEESAVIAQFETHKPHIPELLEVLRAGTLAEPVPVMLDGSTFVVHGATRSFWVKLWHAGGDLSRVERAQVISCLPSTRGVQVIVGDPEDEDSDEDFDDEDFDEADFDEGDFDEEGDDLLDEDEDDADELEHEEAPDETSSSSAGSDSPASDKGETGAR